MPYISRKKYTSRREKREKTTRNLKIVAIAAVLIILILLLTNWIQIKDYITTSFY